MAMTCFEKLFVAAFLNISRDAGEGLSRSFSSHVSCNSLVYGCGRKSELQLFFTPLAHFASSWVAGEGLSRSFSSHFSRNSLI